MTIKPEILDSTDNRFWQKVKKLSNGCWMWLGHIDKKTGYGRFYFGIPRRVNSAHKFAFIRFNGPVLPGNEVHHKCDHKWCVNPEHLKSVTWHEHRLEDGDKFHKACEAWKRAITHCPHGHSYAEFGRWRKNWTGNRQRRCLECDRLYRTRKKDLKNDKTIVLR